MKNFAKILSLGALIAASASFANATVINGQANYTGAEDLTSTSVSFDNGTNGYSFTAYTGGANNFGFAPATTLSGVQFTFSTITFAGLSVATPETLFTYSYNGSTTTFAATQEIIFIPTTAGSAGYLYLLGTLTVGANAGVPASFGLTDLPNSVGANENSGTYVLQVPPAAIAPEPNSLVLLGTGLVSAGGMMLRKRNSIA